MCWEACDATQWARPAERMGPAGTGTIFTSPAVVVAAVVPTTLAVLAYRLWYNRSRSDRSVTQPSYLPVAHQPSNATVNPFEVSTTP
jgi:hypothetical protein